MLSKKLEAALNAQIRIEAESSQVYLSMASWAEVKGLEGVAGFMYGHSDEERMHMLKLVKYVNERGGHAHVPGERQPGDGPERDGDGDRRHAHGAHRTWGPRQQRPAVADDAAQGRSGERCTDASVGDRSRGRCWGVVGSGVDRVVVRGVGHPLPGSEGALDPVDVRGPSPV